MITTDLQGIVEDAAAYLYVWALKDIPQDLRDALADAAERETSVPGQRVTEILRNVLQRPHVEVRRRILDRMLQVGRDNTHAAAFSAAARPARRPKTVHSSSELPIIRFRPCVPPAISPHA